MFRFLGFRVLEVKVVIHECIRYWGDDLDLVWHNLFRFNYLMFWV